MNFFFLFFFVIFQNVFLFLLQERDASKKEEIRLQSQIGLLEDKSSCLEKNIEELKIEHEEEKQKYEKKIEETQKKLKAMTEDRDSRIKRTRLLLDIQKKYEKQQNEAYEQYEELKKVSEDLKERVKDRDALELDLIKYKNRTKELENEIENMGNNANFGASGTTSEMPWDIDPELQDMSARELKAILGKFQLSNLKNVVKTKYAPFPFHVFFLLFYLVCNTTSNFNIYNQNNLTIFFSDAKLVKTKQNIQHCHFTYF